jgi:hypothetical protein
MTILAGLHPDTSTNIKSAMSQTRISLLRPKIHYIRTRIGPFSGLKIRYFLDRHMGELLRGLVIFI